MLSAEELLAGSQLSFKIEIPQQILSPDASTSAQSGELSCVHMKPLTVTDLQVISRAAKEDDNLLGVLMVQKSLLEPQMSVAQVSSLHLGLLQFLLQQVNRISALDMQQETLQHHAQDPIARAAFLLAREFGWSPQQISELTLGQIMLHLEMMNSRKEGA